MRFEAKHAELKKISKNIQSRVNLPYTLSLKLSLNFMYKCLSSNGLKDKISYGLMMDIHERDYQRYNISSGIASNYFGTNWNEKNGIKDTCNSSVIVKEIIDNNPSYFKILHIFAETENQHSCILLCQKLIITLFSEHYLAHQVDLACEHSLIKLSDIEYTFPTRIFCSPDEYKFVTPPNF